jgi:hypothetical protein
VCFTRAAGGLTPDHPTPRTRPRSHLAESRVRRGFTRTIEDQQLCLTSTDSATTERAPPGPVSRATVATRCRNRTTRSRTAGSYQDRDTASECSRFWNSPCTLRIHAPFRCPLRAARGAGVGADGAARRELIAASWAASLAGLQGTTGAPLRLPSRCLLWIIGSKD